MSREKETPGANDAVAARRAILDTVVAAGAVAMHDADLWCQATGFDDLDLWVPDADVLARVRNALWASGVRPADEGPHASRLAGVVGAAPCVLDIAVGDLRAGSCRLLAASDVTKDGTLTPSARVCDLVLRPVLAGRQPRPRHLIAARTAWRAMSADERSHLLSKLPSMLAKRIDTAFDGRVPRRVLWRLRTSRLWRRERSLGLRATLSLATAALWRLIFGVPSAPVVGVVGVDGSGKSTVVEQTVAALNDAGIPAVSVYCGSVRDNIRLVAWLRKRVAERTAGNSSGTHRPGSVSKLALGVLALDGVVRHLTRVAPLARRGVVVVCDRWVIDLYLEPRPGSPLLSRLAQWCVGQPNVAVVADAPVDVIANRCEETTVARAARYQAVYGMWHERQSTARRVVADTSGGDVDAHLSVVAATIAAIAAPADASRM